MSEPEGYAEDAKFDSLPKEYIATMIYSINFQDRTEPPSNGEIFEELRNALTNKSVFASDFDIESVDLA